MKKRVCLVFSLSILMMAGCGGMEEKSDYLVGVRGELTEEDLDSAGLEPDDVKQRFSMMKVYVISMSEEEAEKMERLDKVNYVELDQEVNVPDPPGEK
ncbi:hypothetical protein [Salinicoccus roseus]|uniref:hypothetical protein n=1 Tax=Salinicoccus roseus TaxID=45670 RepID=UPI001CA6FC63|nr:hypothetical protein [Salinicoccus roseus]MBY8910275.1 hypothetical protein [Salinicoccus roseus]